MNISHQKNSQAFLNLMKVNLFAELWAFKFYVLSLIILGLALGAIASFLVTPIFVATAVIRPPMVMGKPLMPSEVIIEQFKYSAYQSEVIASIKPVSASIDKERLVEILSNIQASKVSGNLILTYRGKKSELDDALVEQISQSVIKFLNERYENRISLVKFKLFNIESRIKIASGDKDYLLGIVKKNFSGTTRPDGNDGLFLSSLISSKSFELDNLYSQKFELDDQLSPDKTYPGAIVNDPQSSNYKAFPNRKIFIITGAILGLILAMLIIFVRKIFLGPK